ncbi:Uncharacterised protein [Vibrio cholerae]|nr:Uncharacterised protein [Vibrio cholerae]
MAAASAKPPKNRKMIELAKLFSAAWVSKIPKKTAITGTRIAVTVTCSASVNQSTAMKASILIPNTTLCSKGRKW